MKKILLSILIMFSFMGSLSAEKLDDDGNHNFTFEISELVKKGFEDEIYIQNGSSSELKNIHLKIIINDKVHELLPVYSIKPGEKSFFDGIDDNEMHDELRFAFGKEGKLRKTNKNKITFNFIFENAGAEIQISQFDIRDEKLYFYVADLEK